jgi:ankyrin repeat protein
MKIRKNLTPTPQGAYSKTIENLTQPMSMYTDHYVYGTEVVNGHDAWSLFKACAEGDLNRVSELLNRDSALVNSQHWYQFPLHMAARQGHADVVRHLLNHGADLGKSRSLYSSWDKLLVELTWREEVSVKAILETHLTERFNYNPNFLPVRDAIQARDADRVLNMISENPHLATASDALGNTGLHWSTLTRQMDLIDQFLAWGVPIDAKRADGQTPVMLSGNGDYWYRWYRDLPPEAMQNQWVITGYLLAKGASMTLGLACLLGDLGRVQDILNVDPGEANRLDDQGKSMLYHATRACHVEIVRTLLAHHADPNKPENDATRGHALHEAAARNHLEIVRLLLEAGADPNGSVDSSGSVLYINQYKHPNNCEAVQTLLKSYGAYRPAYSLTTEELKDVLRNNEPTHNDLEFIHEILGKEDVELMDLFLEKHHHLVAQMCPTDVWGGNIPPGNIMQKLIDHGLDIHKPNWIGRTFLHVCANKGRIDTAKVLLDWGADINALDLEYGGTPLAEAVRQNKQEMAIFLLNQGADPDAPAGYPCATARATAARQKDPKMVKLFDSFKS